MEPEDLLKSETRGDDEGVVDVVVDMVLPATGRGGPAVIGSTLGKKVELMSPIPTKKSSLTQGELARVQSSKCQFTHRGRPSPD